MRHETPWTRFRVTLGGSTFSRSDDLALCKARARRLHDAGEGEFVAVVDDERRELVLGWWLELDDEARVVEFENALRLFAADDAIRSITFESGRTITREDVAR